MSDMNINDQCLSLTPGSPYWWLSPDIIMVNMPPDENTANPDAGGNVTSAVTVHNSCEEFDVHTARFDLYVYAPSLSAGPIVDPAGVAVYNPPGGSFHTVTAFGTPVQVPWVVSSDSTKANAADPPHHCLIARCYPLTSPPDPGNIAYVNTDQHYAQHNVTINPIPMKSPKKRIPIRTGNSMREPQLVVIQAVPDLEPAKGTLDTLLPSLKATPGFKQISTKPLKEVSFDLDPLTKKEGGCIFDKIEDFFEDAVKDLLRDLEGKHKKAAPGGSGAHGRVQIPANFYSAFDFNVDITGANPGDAFIYHLTQTTSAGVENGGLTVVAVAV